MSQQLELMPVKPPFEVVAGRSTEMAIAVVVAWCRWKGWRVRRKQYDFDETQEARET